MQPDNRYTAQVASENELPGVARSLVEWLQSHHIKLVTLNGDLGAGKTTLVRQLCTRLGSGDQVSSPTFALVNEYALNGAERIYHIDLYRIKSAEEAQQIGIEDYLYSNSWCFIEWPDVIEDLIPLPHARLEIEVVGDGLAPDSSRIIRILIQSSQRSHG